MRLTKWHTSPRAEAFTLLETLIAVGIIGLLVGVLLPSLSRAREQAAAVVCKSNIRQLHIANELYSRNSGGRYVAGAPRIHTENLSRWHGRRENRGTPFDGRHGPLAPYLGSDGRIRNCPAFRVEPPDSADLTRFESGSGGFGYNNAYLGVRNPYVMGTAGESNTLAGAAVDRVRDPSHTIMFTDAAFAGEALIEYSFAEPRFHTRYGSRADPSIHFRHAKQANVVWCDGHVSSERRTFTWSMGLYSLDPGRFDIGWFGRSDDNSLFDLQ